MHNQYVNILYIDCRVIFGRHFLITVYISQHFSFWKINIMFGKQFITGYPGIFTALKKLMNYLVF